MSTKRVKKNKKKNKVKIDAERIAREEEAKLLKEQEEKKLNEIEKERQKEIIAYRNKEIKRFIEHMIKMINMKSVRSNQLDLDLKMINSDREWQETIRCKSSMYDIKLRDLNTFITESIDLEHSTLKSICKLSDHAYHLIEKMNIDKLYKNSNGMSYGTIKLDEFVVQFRYVLLQKLKIQIQYQEVDKNFNDAAISYSGLHTNASVYVINETGDIKNLQSTNSLLSLVLMLSQYSSNKMNEMKFLILELPFLCHTAKKLSEILSCDEEVITGGTCEVFSASLSKSIHNSKGLWSLQYKKINQDAINENNQIYFDEAINCKIEIPDYIVHPESVKVKVLLGDNLQSAEQTDYDYNKLKRIIVFKLHYTPATIVLVKSCDNFPYKSWKIGPLLPNMNAYKDLVDDRQFIVEYIIETPYFEINVYIFGSQCMLVSPTLPQFKHIIGKEISPSQLILALQKCGVYLLPKDTHIMHTKKVKEIEELFYDDVSILCTSCISENNYMNAKLGKNKSVYEINNYKVLMEMDSTRAMEFEKPGSNCLPEECGKVRCYVTEDEGEEFINETFDFSIREGTESSISALFCLPAITIAEVMKKAEFVSPLVGNTVKELLQLTKPISFC